MYFDLDYYMHSYNNFEDTFSPRKFMDQEFCYTDNIFKNLEKDFFLTSIPPNSTIPIISNEFCELNLGYDKFILTYLPNTDKPNQDALTYNTEDPSVATINNNFFPPFELSSTLLLLAGVALYTNPLAMLAVTSSTLAASGTGYLVSEMGYEKFGEFINNTTPKIFVVSVNHLLSIPILNSSGLEAKAIGFKAAIIRSLVAITSNVFFNAFTTLQNKLEDGVNYVWQTKKPTLQNPFMYDESLEEFDPIITSSQIENETFYCDNIYAQKNLQALFEAPKADISHVRGSPYNYEFLNGAYHSLQELSSTITKYIDIDGFIKKFYKETTKYGMNTLHDIFKVVKWSPIITFGSEFASHALRNITWYGNISFELLKIGALTAFAKSCTKYTVKQYITSGPYNELIEIAAGCLGSNSIKFLYK